MCLVDRYTRTIGTRTAAHIYVYPLRDSLVVCALSGVFVVVCRGWGGGAYSARAQAAPNVWDPFDTDQNVDNVAYS